MKTSVFWPGNKKATAALRGWLRKSFAGLRSPRVHTSPVHRAGNSHRGNPYCAATCGDALRVQAAVIHGVTRSRAEQTQARQESSPCQCRCHPGAHGAPNAFQFGGGKRRICGCLSAFCRELQICRQPFGQTNLIAGCPRSLAFGDLGRREPRGRDTPNGQRPYIGSNPIVAVSFSGLETLNLRFHAPLVRRRFPIHVVDHKHLHGDGCGLQLQPQLFI